MTHFLKFILLSIFLSCSTFCFSVEDSVRTRNPDFQIYLKQPAKLIKLIMYEKDFTPIQGTLSEDKKSIIIKNYKTGTRVHVKVEYADGTVDEFVKSPCYIDPVIT